MYNNNDKFISIFSNCLFVYLFVSLYNIKKNLISSNIFLIYFGVIDMKECYFQMPLAEESREWWNAFLIDYGLLEWLRVSMGLKSAGTNFQK